MIKNHFSCFKGEDAMIIQPNNEPSRLATGDSNPSRYSNMQSLARIACCDLRHCDLKCSKTQKVNDLLSKIIADLNLSSHAKISNHWFRVNSQKFEKNCQEIATSINGSNCISGRNYRYAVGPLMPIRTSKNKNSLKKYARTQF